MLLKMHQIGPGFYTRFEKPIYMAAEKFGREQLAELLKEFAALPFEKRQLAFDACHASARHSEDSTGEALYRHLQWKCFWLMNMHTKDTTNCANKNENVMSDALWDELTRLKIFVKSAAHDDCKSFSKQLRSYNETMKKEHPEQAAICGPAEDNNDAWHGQKSNVHLIEKMIEEYTKAIKQGKKDKISGKLLYAKEDAITIKNKAIAHRQIMTIKQRVTQAMLQVCNAAEGSTDNDFGIDCIRDMLFQCLIQDEHGLCMQVNGTDCPCAADKRARDRMDQHRNPEVLHSEKLNAELPFEISADGRPDYTNNNYYVQERIERRWLELGYPQSKTRKRRKAGEAEGEDQVQQSDNGNSDSDSDEAVMNLKGVDGTVDPFQPVRSVLTHPIAVSWLLAYADSSELETHMTTQKKNDTTSFVESMHNVFLTYRPKRKHFNTSHNGRIACGRLDWNENVVRRQVKAKTSRRKRPATPKTYKFMTDITDYALPGCWKKHKPRDIEAAQ
jgi:hypothetical protein